MRRISILLFLWITFLITQAVAQNTCTASGDPSVAICLPANGSNPISPIHIQLATNDSKATVDLLQIYYNRVKRWEEHEASADFYLLAQGGGPYHITAVAHDTMGRWFQTSADVTITNIDICNPDQATNQAPHSVLVCMPTDGEIHTSPLRITWDALPASGKTLNAVQVYIDGVRNFSSPPALGNGFLLPAVYLPLSIGRHHIAVQGYDGTTPFKTSLNVTISSINQGCAPPPTLPGVVLCSLTDGQLVNGPVLIEASAASANGIQEIQTWVDGAKQNTTGHAWADFAMTLPSGPHTIEIIAVDYNHTHYTKTVNVTVQ